MRLRAKGQSWRVIARQVGVSVRPLRQAYQSRGKRVAKPIPGPKPHQFYQITDSQGRPRPGVTVTFWTSSGTGILCTPLVRIFTDASLTIPAANPMTTDGLGNLPVIYAASGVYKYTVSGTSVTSSGPLTATVAARNVLLAGNNSFTGSNSFSQQIISTVSTGTGALQHFEHNSATKPQRGTSPRPHGASIVDRWNK
jgi:hypothetical protein